MISFIFSLFCSFTFAYVPKAETIIDKVIENNGSGIYQINQELLFNSNVHDPLVVKESWIIEDENRMKLIVSLADSTKSNGSLVFLFENGQRTQIINGQKVQKNTTFEFFEKYFHFRKLNNFETELEVNHFFPQNYFTKRHNSKDLDPLLSLSRVGGVIAYAMGESTSSNKPVLYVEQDQFVIRKIRFSENAELSADNIIVYTRGLNYPKAKTLKWGDHLVNIQTLQVLRKTGTRNSLFKLEASSDKLFENLGDFKESVEEFYKRFR